MTILLLILVIVVLTIANTVTSIALLKKLSLEASLDEGELWSRQVRVNQTIIEVLNNHSENFEILFDEETIQ